MRKKVFEIILLITIVFFSTVGTVLPQETKELLTKMGKQLLISRLEKNIPLLMDHVNIPGLSIAVIRDGKIIWHKDFGKKNVKTGELVDENTIFEAASLTKPFFAYLVMNMVEKGEIDLDRPLVEYVPKDYLEKKYIGHSFDYKGFNRDWFEKITARMVLSHSSGLPHGGPRKPLPVLFEPSTKYRYSADGYLYLQRIIEYLRDKPLQEIMKTDVIDPLDMKHSSMVWQKRYESQAAVGHNISGETNGKFRKRKEAHSGASLYTTAEDYAKFVTAIMNNKGLKNETIEKMLTPAINVSGKVYWSLGFGVDKTDNGNAFWQWGDYLIFRNFIYAYKDQKIGVVYFTNSENGLSIGHEIVKLAVGGDAPGLKYLNYLDFNTLSAILIEKEITVDKNILKTYKGEYQLTPDLIIKITLKDGKLMAQATGQGKAQIFAKSEVEFFYKTVKAEITFEKDKTGKVTRLILHQNGKDMPAKKIK
ncbi:serine hydrolase [candidate division KSB1 bacterium]